MRVQLLVFFLLLAIGHYGQETAKGRVFDDANGNGRRDRNEKGISGTAVSNGRDVVVTASDGSYQIPIREGDILFVIKPSGYQYPVDNYQLPQFYYIHKPKGSPALKFPGSEPSGKLPPFIDFPLKRTNETDTFSIVVFSDPQPYNEQQLEWYGKVVEQELSHLRGHSFGVTLGDLTGDRPDFFQSLNEHTARAGIPWFHAIGNHDLNYDAEDIAHSDESFEKIYGPSTYAFNHGKVHFVVLNNVIFPNTHSSGRYVGGLTDDQLQFLYNDLQHVPSDRLVVLMMHIPLYNPPGWGVSFLPESRRRLFDLLKDFPHTFSMAGHMHLQRHDYFGAEDDWFGTTLHHHYTVGTIGGDWWSGSPDAMGVPEATMYDGTPKGYNLIRFEGVNYQWDYKVVGASEDERMRVYHPKVYAAGKNQRADIYVNFYQGSITDSVFFSFDGASWNKMRYVVEPDPFSYAVVTHWDNSNPLPEGSRPSQPLECRHLWKARPGKLPGKGVHTLYVRAYQHGRVFEARSLVEVD
ncbi:MAG: calcineurin-like phosphoesterase family protein [Bacteroidetes bacterium]|nr:calcineurin-like phosphoesterase family protein [Bacteroidota bacterium]